MCFHGSHGQESCSCNKIINSWIEKSPRKSVKLTTAAGFDGVYLEFIRNFDEKTNEWLISFMKDVLSSASLPKLFKRTKVIANLRPGQVGSEPAHYPPILLLSVMFKLLERLILQRIQLLEAATPVHQAAWVLQTS
jgi:hypothetical protein